MTLDEARQLLDAVRAGTSNPPWSRVRLALQMTGDIPGAWSSVQPRPGKRPSRAIAGCEAA